MDSLVSLDQIKKLEPTAAARYDDERLQSLLDVASADFRRDTHQVISLVTDDVEIHDPYGAPIVLLKQLPVIDVSAIVVSGVPLSDVSGLWTADGVVRRTLLRCPTPFPSAGRSVAVTYSHGFEEVPADIVDAIIERALDRGARKFGRVPAQTTVGPFTVINGQANAGGGYGGAGGGGSTEKWADAVAAYKVDR